MINILVSQVGLSGPPGQNSGVESEDGVLLQEDWISATSVGNNGFTSSASNGGVSSIIASESGHPGLCRMSTGASSSLGYSNLYLGTNAIIIGNGILAIEALIRFPTLSSGSEQYISRIGLGDTLTGDFSYGIWLEYNQGTSNNWLICCNNNSSASKTISSILVTENTWIKLKIVVNATGTSAEFFINGTSIGTLSSNLPNSVTSPRLNITKAVGTSARFLEADYYQIQHNLTTSR